MIKYIIMILIPWIVTLREFSILYNKYKEAKHEIFRLRISESCLQYYLNEKNGRLQKIIDRKEEMIRKLKEENKKLRRIKK